MIAAAGGDEYLRALLLPFLVFCHGRDEVALIIAAPATNGFFVLHDAAQNFSALIAPENLGVTTGM